MTDAEGYDLVLDRARAGDPAAFAELYVRHMPRIRAYARARCSSWSLADDIVSDTFLRAWQRLFLFTSGNFEAWLTRIARNALLDHVKSAAHRLEVSVEDLPVAVRAGLHRRDSDDAEDQVRSDAQERVVRFVFRSIGVDQAECLRLRFMLDRTIAETATLMGRSPGAVKLLQHRAMATARQQVDSEDLSSCGIDQDHDPGKRQVRHRISVQRRDA